MNAFGFEPTYEGLKPVGIEAFGIKRESFEPTYEGLKLQSGLGQKRKKQAGMF